MGNVKTTYLTFNTSKGTAAVTSDELAAILDQPPLGPIPVPFGPARELVAHDGELYPVIALPPRDDDKAQPPVVLVLRTGAGNLGLKVRSDLRLATGQRHGTQVNLKEIGQARLLTCATLLTELERKREWPAS